MNLSMSETIPSYSIKIQGILRLSKLLEVNTLLVRHVRLFDDSETAYSRMILDGMQAKVVKLLLPMMRLMQHMHSSRVYGSVVT